MSLKNTHTCNNNRAKTTQRHQAAVLTSKPCKVNLFVAASVGTDLSTGWLIIYPAGFMALINFAPSLSLPSIESLKSTCIWC